MLNYSSGVLAASGDGQQQARVVLVNRAEIAQVERGPTVGIAGIPDSLPSKSGLVSSPWTVCSRQRATTPTHVRIRVSLSVGDGTGGHALPARRSLVVRSASDSTRYLLWNGKRLRVGSAAIATLLDIQSVDPLVVGTAFLDAVPQGPALNAPDIAGVGGPGPTVDGQPTRVGRSSRRATRGRPSSPCLPECNRSMPCRPGC